MPNTLAHFGVQILPWKSLDCRASIRWLGLGCIIPDVPWIAQRLVPVAFPSIDLITLRVYCMIEASLLFCLLLSGVFAALSRNSRRVFTILAVSSLTHLLLDAVQTKWANGVHLFAPFSWEMTHFQLFWPEDPLTLGLSLVGLSAIIVLGWRERWQPVEWRITGSRTLLAVLLLVGYLAFPLLFKQGPIQADNHYVSTLLEINQRNGKNIEFDRCYFDQSASEIKIFSGERIAVLGQLPRTSGIISLSGHFVGPSTILIEKVHRHSRWRDALSLIGLLLLAVIWLVPLLQRRATLNSTFCSAGRSD